MFMPKPGEPLDTYSARRTVGYRLRSIAPGGVGSGYPAGSGLSMREGPKRNSPSRISICAAVSPPTRVTCAGVRTGFGASAPGSEARPLWPSAVSWAASGAASGVASGVVSDAATAPIAGLLVVLAVADGFTGSGILLGSLS